MVSNNVSPAQQRACQRRQKDIGRQLTLLWADVANEPAPENLLCLLEQADLRQTVRKQPT
jgi:hypothetical protein